MKIYQRIITIVVIVILLCVAIGTAYAQGDIDLSTVDAQSVVDGIFSEAGFVAGFIILVVGVSAYLFFGSLKKKSQSSLIVSESNLVATKSEAYVTEEMFKLFKESVTRNDAIQSKNYELVSDANNENKTKIEQLESKIKELEKEAASNRELHKKQVADKETEIKRLLARIEILEPYVEDVTKARLELASERGTLKALREQYEKERKEWRETYQDLLTRLQQTGSKQTLDDTIALPHTLIITPEAVTSEAVQPLDKPDNASNSQDNLNQKKDIA